MSVAHRILVRPSLRVGRGLLVCVLGSLIVFPFSGMQALPVNLGTAGPGNWAVLQVGDGTTKQKIDLSNSQGSIWGNVGVQRNGEIQGSGPRIMGDLYLGNNASAQFSGSYTGNRPISGITHRATGATVGPGSYAFTTVSDDPQVLLNQARRDAIAASGAADQLVATSGLSQIKLDNTNMTLFAGVYDLTQFEVSKATLTLSGPGSFVFNISSSFKLDSGKILLAGGALDREVLFNYTGTNDVAISGGELHGIILALNAKINLSPGLIVGEIIAGKDISMSSGAIVESPRLAQSVPDSPSTLALFCLACSSLILSRRLVPGIRPVAA